LFLPLFPRLISFTFFNSFLIFLVFPAISLFPTYMILFSPFISFIVSLHRFSFLLLCLFYFPSYCLSLLPRFSYVS
jgi:hypothetical protein